MRGKCDYCNRRRLLDPKTKFCKECTYNFDATVDKYFDGNPLEPLEIIANISGDGNRPKKERQEP